MARGYKTGGRSRGTPNRTTGAMRDAIDQALDEAGGVDYLVQVARDDPRTFCGLLAKLLVVESGDVFWKQVIDQPPNETELAPENRRLLEGFSQTKTLRFIPRGERDLRYHRA